MTMHNMKSLGRFSFSEHSKQSLLEMHKYLRTGRDQYELVVVCDAFLD